MFQCSESANRIERTGEVFHEIWADEISPYIADWNKKFTRWNAIYLLLESVMTHFVDLEHILNNRNELHRLAGIDKKHVEELVSFL